MTHVDLFSGIGGFAYAVDQVWDDVEHIFCDNDKFCQQVLKKHWPGSLIYDDIRDITDTEGEQNRWLLKSNAQSDFGSSVDLLTGGFPCQPFSNAGLRRGTSDDRYLWPEMLRVIRLTKPQWVIAENVNGLLTLLEGVVFEQVCADLEAAGYEVQPFVIPAVAVNAPHRRDRVWIIGKLINPDINGFRGYEEPPKEESGRRPETAFEPANSNDTDTNIWQSRPGDVTEPIQTPQSEHSADDTDASNSPSSRPQNHVAKPETEGRAGFNHRKRSHERTNWNQDWLKVATELCSVDDGLPVELDGFKLSKPQHRKEQLKAYGNAIVPQVAVEILRAIKQTTK